MAYLCELSSNQQVYLENQDRQTSVTLKSSGSGQQQQASSSFETGRWSAPPQAFKASEGVVIKIYTDHGEQILKIQGSSVTMAQAADLSTSQQLPVQSVDAPKSSMKPMEPMEPMQMGSMAPMEFMKPMQSGEDESRHGSADGEVRQSMKPMEPMRPMKKMQPIKMGSMEMNSRPMEMRMGNMHMQMGHMRMGNMQMGNVPMGNVPVDSMQGSETGSMTPAEPRPAAIRRFCSQCGVPVDPNDRFCSSCGHQLSGGSASS